MTDKRILLIHSDRTLQRLYREKLEASGFTVDAASDPEQAKRMLAVRIPDVLLLDLVFRQGDSLDFIKSVRAQYSSGKLPMLVLPTGLFEFGSAAIEAGAAKVIQRRNNPIASIISAVKASLGLPELGSAADVALFKPDDAWLNAVLSTSVDQINHMRQCLPGIGATPPEPAALRSLWNLVHCFADRTWLLPYKPLAQFVAALDLLLHDLNESPEQLNVSTLRTVGQALDFLATILDPERLAHLADPSSAKVLVVDDEPSALLFISAALQLAGLQCESASAPSSGLEKLSHDHWGLIFLDIGLPQVDGFELCTKIRAIENHKTTPIVFITGLASFKNKATACLSGGNDFVGKPFNLPELGVKALTWLYRGQLQNV
jgi:DNA-binding response OmpR family regulator